MIDRKQFLRDRTKEFAASVIMSKNTKNSAGKNA